MSEESETEADLLDELVLGSARGGKAGRPLEVRVVRSLTELDLPLLQTAPPVTSPVVSLRELRTSHHQLAQLLARGETNENCSLITGYSTSYISKIKNDDPAFGELLAAYSAEREAVFVDTIEQLRVLGLSFKEELQQRLEESPAKFTNREVMEAMKLLLIDSRPGSGVSGGSGGAGINISVSFEAPAARSVPESSENLAVDVQFEEIIE